MRVSQEKVEDFMTKIGDSIAAKPEVGDRQDGLRRYKLMAEELGEYLDALTNGEGDLVKIADALGDLVYTVLGTASHHGIALTPIFDEVHRSNMTKEPVKGDGFKLCRKGPSFKPPRIAEILMLEMMGMTSIQPAKR